jgi:hypothetical protein
VDETCSTYGEFRNAYYIIRTEWKCPHGGPTRKLDGNIKMYIRETVCKDLD